jgi:hypothetical protein
MYGFGIALERTDEFAIVCLAWILCIIGTIRKAVGYGFAFILVH